MIGTIGFLVQETSNRMRRLLAASLYTLACVITAMMLGAVLATAGYFFQHIVGDAPVWGDISPPDAWLVGLIAIAYACSDAGLTPLPCPILMEAVPVTWWRAWRPYGAAIAYGAALGLGVTTRIVFGAFYVLCAQCFLNGDVRYGALLMGTYGMVRALVMFPASWGVYCHRESVASIGAWLAGPLFDQQRAQRLMTAALMFYGVQVVVSVAILH